MSISEGGSVDASKYNLHPRNKEGFVFVNGIEGGLGFVDEKSSKSTTRGRKSYMSLAQKHACNEICLVNNCQ